MTREEAKAAFVPLQAEQRLRVLALLAHNVTVAARTAYPGQVEDRLIAAKLRAFNEVLHTITGQLMHLLARDANGYPDDLFVDALFERAQQGNCGKDLADAFAWTYAAACSAA
jgi:hypothetical protein